MKILAGYSTSCKQFTLRLEPFKYVQHELKVTYNFHTYDWIDSADNKADTFCLTSGYASRKTLRKERNKLHDLYEHTLGSRNRIEASTVALDV